MAKFNGRTCIIYTKYVSGGVGVNPSEVERERLIQRDEDETIQERKIGTSKQINEVNEKEVVVKGIVSKVAVGGRIKKDFVNEAVFDLYLDFLTASASSTTTPNQKQSLLVGEKISISELKSMENNWSSIEPGYGTNLVSLSRANIGDKKSIAKACTTLYSVIDSLQKSKATIDNNFFGDLSKGQGSETCSADVESLTAFKTNTLLKQVDGVYVNKVGGVTDAKWLDLVNNASMISCS